MDPQVQQQIPQVPVQNLGQVPQQPNPYAVMGAPIPGQYIGTPVPMQIPAGQPVVAAPQQDSLFDKFLKGIIDFI